MRRIPHQKILSYLKRRWYHFIPLAIIAVWVVPFFSTGNKIELGDFSFFSQAYEAIRVSILQYHQFPWWNPWISGGVPLYANPQMGVFSLQTLLVLVFGTVAGLKISLAIYTFLGYFSMLLLLGKYFKIKPLISIPLSLAWIFSSFFVAHLPPHYTFLWFMLAPLYVYLALTIKTYKGGIVLGAAMAVMALSAVHYPLFYISAVVGVILVVRLFKDKTVKDRKAYLIGVATMGATFLVIAGHRLYLAYVNAVSFNREVASDPAISPLTGIRAISDSFSRTALVNGTVNYPKTPFGWGETTASLGIVIFIAAIIIAIYLFVKRKKLQRKLALTLLILVILGGGLFYMGLGNYGILSPYDWMKHLPVLGNLRVSTRWFIFVDLIMVIFIAVAINKLGAKKARLFFIGLIYIGVIELFANNFWYQNNIFTHTPNTAPNSISSYKFDQTHVFGDVASFPDGKVVATDSTGKAYYREYEAMTYNIGIINANEALVNNMFGANRCAYEDGCGLVLSDNADVTYWSPNKITLTRTAPGDIRLNVNASSYIKINGVKATTKKTADVSSDVIITDSSNTIDVTYSK